MQTPEQLEHFETPGGVERAGGLVGEHERRLVGEGAGDGEALTLTAGQHAGRVPRLVGEPEEVEQVARPRLGLPAGHAGDDGRQRDVLQNAHALEQVEELEDDADVTAAHTSQVVLVLADEGLAGDADLPVGRRVEARYQVQQC